MKTIHLILLYVYLVSAMLNINLIIPSLLLIFALPFQSGYGKTERSFNTLLILFLSLIIFSLFWTISLEHTYASIKDTGSAVIFAFSVRLYINDRHALYEVLHMFIISGVVLLLFLIAHGLFNITLTSRIDTSQMNLGDKKFNFNSISSNMLFMSIALYILSKRYKKIFYNIVFVLFLIATLVLTIISGSKMSIMMFILTVFFWYYNRGKNRRRIGWLNIIVIAFALVGVMWLSLNNETLYQIYGYRYESLYKSLFEGGEGTFSDQAREELINLAYKTFLQYPILGCGANAFRFISNHSGGIVNGLDYYTHNNYLELLATLGIVGFVIFYAIFYSLYKYIKRNVDKTTARFLYFIMFLLLLNDFGTVTYRIPQRWMIIVLMYSFVSLVREIKCREKVYKLNK